MKPLEQNIKELASSLPKKNLDNKLYQYFECVNLYIDTDDNKSMCDYLFAYLNKNKESYKFAFIFHDKDVYQENTFNDNFELIGKAFELKKAHYHCYIYCVTPVTETDLSNKLGCKVRHFKPKSWDNKLLYLTHIAHSDKHQYNSTDIVTNIRPYVDFVYSQFHKQLSPLDYALMMVNCEDNQYRCITFKEFLRCLESYDEIDYSKLYKEWSIIKALLDEHNKYIDIIDEHIESKKVDAIIEKYRSDRNIDKACDCLGTITVEKDNNLYVVSKLPKDKKGK